MDTWTTINQSIPVVCMAEVPFQAHATIASTEAAWPACGDRSTMVKRDIVSAEGNVT
jgi:hypothetical protein